MTTWQNSMTRMPFSGSFCDITFLLNAFLQNNIYRQVAKGAKKNPNPE